MHARLGIRSATLLFGILALLVGGCGTLSRSGTSESALLASTTLIPPAPGGTDRADAPVEPMMAAGPAETRVDAAPAAPISDATPVAQEPRTPSTVAPDASAQEASTVIGQATPADPAVDEKRGTVEPVPDVQIEEYDPWEPFNEKMFTFNYNFDKYLFKPVAKAYNFVMPDMFQQMISHGFDNINVVPKLANNLLQLNLKGFGVELGRFVINSTLGIGGLFDIAKQEFGLQKTKVDFGQTLGKWGVGPGPFLILPFMPPLTVRDGIGYGADGAMDPLSYVLPFIWPRLGMKIGDMVNERSLNLDLFQGLEETTVDLYSAARNGYLQRRYNMIKGSQ